jgi:endonuclease YncB( thermonuclease family)
MVGLPREDRPCRTPPPIGSAVILLFLNPELSVFNDLLLIPLPLARAMQRPRILDPMHSRVAAAMRARRERLAAAPVQDRSWFFRIFRLSRTLLILVGGVVAGLFLAGAFDIDIFPHWRGRLVEPAGFTLCRKSNRQNCVIDGDTIRHDGVAIRIVGIDAPETHGFKCEMEHELGVRATERLLQLINAGPFEIVYTGGRDTDKYGRQLRALERDGRSFGDVLIAEGLARRWDGAHRSWCD